MEFEHALQNFDDTLTPNDWYVIGKELGFPDLKVWEYSPTWKNGDVWEFVRYYDSNDTENQLHYPKGCVTIWYQCDGYNVIYRMHGKYIRFFVYLPNTSIKSYKDFIDAFREEFKTALQEQEREQKEQEQKDEERKTRKEEILKKKLEFPDFRKVGSNCYFFNLFTCYIPKEFDLPLELLDEGDGVWMVACTNRIPKPKGYKNLKHYSDDLGFWGKDFISCEQAIEAYNKLIPYVVREVLKQEPDYFQ